MTSSKLNGENKHIAKSATDLNTEVDPVKAFSMEKEFVYISDGPRDTNCHCDIENNISDRGNDIVDQLLVDSIQIPNVGDAIRDEVAIHFPLKFRCRRCFKLILKLIN